MRILTIETTCDETASAIVTEDLEVLSSVVASQDQLHQRYAGVVPEIAARAHVERILPVIDEALKRASLQLVDVDAIAVANTPGLAGSLLVGVVAAKTLCAATSKPLVAVNHLYAHIYACRMAARRDIFPCVGLIVSGGHTSLYRCETPTDFSYLGGTIDDAAGEAFDKVAAMLGLSYPGGPAISQVAERGNPNAYRFPRSLAGDRENLNFSFSGLKTAVRYAISPPKTDARPVKAAAGSAAKSRPNRGALADLTPQQIADLAASFQAAAVDSLVSKSMVAIEKTGLRTLCVGGGVAANRLLREQLAAAAHKRNVDLHIAPPELCTDNAVMGAVAFELLRAGKTESLDLEALPGLIRH